jgi:hypothetical protein
MCIRRRKMKDRGFAFPGRITIESWVDFKIKRRA